MKVVGLVLMAFIDSALAESKEHYPNNLLSWNPSPGA